MAFYKGIDKSTRQDRKKRAEARGGYEDEGARYGNRREAGRPDDRRADGPRGEQRKSYGQPGDKRNYSQPGDKRNYGQPRDDRRGYGRPGDEKRGYAPRDAAYPKRDGAQGYTRGSDERKPYPPRDTARGYTRGSDERKPYPPRDGARGYTRGSDERKPYPPRDSAPTRDSAARPADEPRKYGRPAPRDGMAPRDSAARPYPPRDAAKGYTRGSDERKPYPPRDSAPQREQRPARSADEPRKYGRPAPRDSAAPRGRYSDYAPRGSAAPRDSATAYDRFRYDAPGPVPAPATYDAHGEDDADVVPNENLLSGRNPIREALRSGRDIEKLLVARGELSGSARELVAQAREKHIPVQEVDRARLDAITRNHQGMLAFASAYQYHTVEDMLALAKERGQAPFLVMLDGVTDPHNLGAIIRTAECAGAHGVIVQERRAVGLTPAAVKASAGAVEHLFVARVTNLTTTLEALKKQGVWAFAADMEGEGYQSVDFSGPMVLVLGAEGEGISRRVLDSCDRRVSLPMRGKLESLNASVAAGILLYAAMRYREP